MNPTAGQRPWPTTLLRIGITVLALGLLARLFDPTRILQLVGHARPPWLLAGAAGAAVYLWTMAARWQLLHRLLVGVPLGYRAAYLGLGRSLLLGQFLPAVVGMDAVRIAAVSSRDGMLAAARSVVCDRIVGSFALVVLVALTLPVFAFLTHNLAAASVLLPLSLAGMIAVVGVITWPMLFARLPVLGGFLATAAGDLRLAFVSATGLQALALGFLSHLVSALMFVAFARALGSDLSLVMCVLIMPSALLVSTVPVSLGGWGVREAAIASAFAMIGADPARGLAAGLLFGLSAPLSGAAVEAAVGGFDLVRGALRRRSAA